MTLKVRVTVIVEKDGDGYYAYAPALQGLHVGGNTVKEALTNAEDGIIWYLDSLAKHGEEFPVGPFLSIEKRLAKPATRPTAICKNISLQWPFQPAHGVSLRA